MPVSSKLLTLVAGIGGSCVLVPVILWSTNNLGASKAQSELSSQAISSLPEQQTSLGKIVNAESGNCEVIEDLEDILQHFGKEKEIYTTVLCKNTNKDSDIKMKGNWTGLFPNDLLINIHTLTKGKRFEIKTETSTLKSGKYKTTFSGNKFENLTVVGEWGDVTADVSGKTVTIFKVLNEPDVSDPIYLLFFKES